MDRSPQSLPAINGANRVDPNGGSVALGHPFGATGARILSQAVKELAAMPIRNAWHCQYLRGWGPRQCGASGESVRPNPGSTPS